MKIKCVIIDDEPLAIKVIENHLKELQNFEVINTFNNPLEALPLLEIGEVDVLFLDINMPKMNGLEFAKILSPKTNVIISTAYREYAVESYAGVVVSVGAAFAGECEMPTWLLL